MDYRFNDIFTRPENDVFQVVFFPDRIYHAQYLNATRSTRYRYNVREVRGKQGINVLKGEVYLDGDRLGNFLRIEYRSNRLVEVAREESRFLRNDILAYVSLNPDNDTNAEFNNLRLHYCPWIDAYQVEIWETLEAPRGTSHDFKVLDLMGHQGSIVRIPTFNSLLADVKSIRTLDLAFRESDRDYPYGYAIRNPVWDNNYGRTYQSPENDTPSSNQNTIETLNYRIDFQRGWFLQAEDVPFVSYQNALIESDSPDFRPGTDTNVVHMRWIFQREFGSSMVFFHEVTIPPGVVEGTHRHIGSEELYYITEGEGVAYMGVGDDPSTDDRPTETKRIFGLGDRDCKVLDVKPGSTIFTKSGGIHGIKNTGTEPLKFIAFLYHSS